MANRRTPGSANRRIWRETIANPTPPTKPARYSRQGYHEDDLIDFTPGLKAEAVAIAEQYVRGPM
jgi:hypothetical protein